MPARFTYSSACPLPLRDARPDPARLAWFSGTLGMAAPAGGDPSAQASPVASDQGETMAQPLGTDPSQHSTFLEYGRYVHLKLAAALAAASLLAYLLVQPATGHYGGTWLGYTLGTIGALIIGLLLWLGVRKRQYVDGPGSLMGWLSAHVYLGVALVVVATLHAGFELGWNLHGLAYVLMLAVVASGIYGVIAYVRLPRRMTANLGEDTLDTLMLKIADLDRDARRVALALPNDINALVLEASQATRVGGSLRQQLRTRHPDCPTTRALVQLMALGVRLQDDQAQAHRSLCELMLRKQALLQRARRDVAYRARMQLWLYLHVPLSIGLLAALAAHILSVFFYW